MKNNLTLRPQLTVGWLEAGACELGAAVPGPGVPPPFSKLILEASPSHGPVLIPKGLTAIWLPLSQRSRGHSGLILAVGGGERVTFIPMLVT